MVVFFFFKQKTAYEMRISDWSSDVCSSDLFPRTMDLAAVHPSALQVDIVVEHRDDVGPSLALKPGDQLRAGAACSVDCQSPASLIRRKRTWCTVEESDSHQPPREQRPEKRDGKQWIGEGHRTVWKGDGKHGRARGRRPDHRGAER